MKMGNIFERASKGKKNTGLRWVKLSWGSRGGENERKKKTTSPKEMKVGKETAGGLKRKQIQQMDG